MGEHSLVIRFLTGRLQGSEVTLPTRGEVRLGRAAHPGIVLLDGMASRQHASLVVGDGGVTVEDLDASNGTFVNGRRIRGIEPLELGDRLLLGATIVTLAAGKGGGLPTPDRVAGDGEPVRADGRDREDLPDGGLGALLEARRGGEGRQRLEVSLDCGEGHVVLEDGRVRDCGLQGLPEAPPRKVLLRMLAAAGGSVSLGAASDGPAARLDLEVSALLVEARRELDEFDVLRQRLPPDHVDLVLARPMLASLSELDEGDLELLRTVHNVGRVGRVIDACPMLDSEVVRRLLRLMERGYLRRG